MVVFIQPSFGERYLSTVLFNNLLEVAALPPSQAEPVPV
jgi:hypothetical protein